MGIFSKLWAALGRLTDNVNALADTFGAMNAEVRARTGLDVVVSEPASVEATGSPSGEPAALPEPVGSGNGRRKRS